MVSGDDEYREPNKLLPAVILAISAAAVVISIGFFISRQTIIVIENDKYNPTLELAMKIG